MDYVQAAVPQKAGASRSGDVKPAPRKGDLGFFCLLIPLDIGESYVFIAPKGSDAGATWKSLVRADSNWSADQLSEQFEKPFGFAATYRFQHGYPELDMALTHLPFLIRGDNRFSAQVRIFTIGIGFFEVSGPISEDIQTVHARVARDRDAIKKAFQSALENIVPRYREEMKFKGRFRRRSPIRRLTDVSRRQRVAEFAYSLLFTEEREPALVNEERLGTIVYEYGEETKVRVGWADSVIRTSKSNTSEFIKNDFAIALACWYALYVMDKLTTASFYNALFDLACNRKPDSGSKIRTTTATYLEAASLSHPIHWTTRRADLELLEKIHLAWGSHRWWDQIERRTETFAAYNESLNAKEAESRDRIIAVTGAALAAFVLPSAIKDLYDLACETHASSVVYGLTREHGIEAAFVAPVIPFVLLLLFWFSYRKR